MAGKIQRIKSMSGYYRRGLVKHNKIGIGPYEIELLGFPKSKKWHMIDCAAYITQVLDKGDMYFQHAGVEKDTADKAEEEYKVMMQEAKEEMTPLEYLGCAP